MQRRGSGGATTWAIDAAAWVSPWVAVFFFFLGVDGRLWGVVVVSGVCTAVVVVIVVLEQKERERKNK